MPFATGEVVLFSDANSLWDRYVLRHIVRNFADPKVGYVTGKMIYIKPDGSAVGDGCSFYMSYENLLRTAETNVKSVVGVNGGVDAIRNELYRPMNSDQLPDFVLPLRVVEQGYRVVFEEKAITSEVSLKDGRDEYKMRVRVALRSFWALWEMRQMLSIKKYKFFAVQLWSHKVLRYMAFVFLTVAYLANLMPDYRWLFLYAPLRFSNDLIHHRPIG